MRLFVGIALANKTRDELEHFVLRLREVTPNLRWSLPSQWHITLQFLDEVQESNYSRIVQELRTVQAEPVEISFVQPGFFERAKVFHIEVNTSKTLLALHEQTENALVPCGYKLEARAYSPHVTLARSRGDSFEFKGLQQMIQDLPVLFSSFTATEFLLYQSISERSGSQYEVRERFRIK